MSRESEMAKNTLILFIGKISTQFISFFLMPIYTAVLTTSEYGLVDLFTTYIQLLMPIATLCLETAAFRFLLDAKDNEEEKKNIISNTFSLLFYVATALSLLYLAFNRYIQLAYKEFFIYNLIATMFAAMFLQYARGLKNLTSYSIASFISALTNIVFNILFIVILRQGPVGMLKAQLLSNIMVVFYLAYANHLYKYIRIVLPQNLQLKKMLNYSLPVIPNTISGWIMNASDRTIVTFFLGISFTGLLTVANKFSNLFLSFYNIFYLSWTEMSVLHLKDEDGSEFFSRMFSNIFVFFFYVAMLIIAAMPIVFPIMINEQFDMSYYLIPISLLAVLANIGVGMLGTVYITFEKTSELAKITTTAAIINIIVHAVLIKFIGLYAAPISTLVGYSTVLVLRIIDVQKYIKFDLNLKKYGLVVALLITTLIFYYLRNIVFIVVILLIDMGFFFYNMRDIIKTILDKVLAKFH